MSDSEAKYNLLKSSCFTPSAANQANGSSTMYALADGWVLGGGSDSRAWGAGHAEWAVELPAGTYTLLYEVDGKQGSRYDALQAFIDTKVIAAISHHDGPYIAGAKFTLDADSTVKIMVKCFAPARYRLMLVEGNTPAAWAPAEGETIAGGGCSHER